VLHHIKKHNKQKGMNTDSQTQHNLNVAKCLKDGLIIGISKQYAKLKLDGKGRHPYLDIKRMQVSNPGWLTESALKSPPAHWKHRIRCIFDGVTPDVSCVVSEIKEELHQWSLTGARGVSHLLAQEPRVG